MTEKEPIRTEISRGEFFTYLNGKRKQLCAMYDEGMGIVQEAQDGLVECQRLETQLLDLEDNDYRVTYFIDEEGSITYSAKQKGRMGFKHE